MQPKPPKRRKKANQIARIALLDTTLIKVRFGVLARWTLTMFLLGARAVKVILKIAKCCVKPTIAQKVTGSYRALNLRYNNSSSRCIHPKAPRPLTTREGARIQCFPDDYKFFGSRSEKNLQIGNAVPAFMSTALAEAISGNFKHEGL